jgi:hypothetical protein
MKSMKSSNRSAQILRDMQQSAHSEPPELFVQKAYMRLQEVKNPVQAALALSVLDNLRAAAAKYATSELPNVHIAEVESTSTILVEWIFPEHRLVFNIEEDVADSGWVFVSKSGAIDLGDIETADFNQLVQRSLKGSI